jgi:hypothetical protein
MEVRSAWIPLGDVPMEEGAFVALENSHTNDRLRNGYGSRDADEEGRLVTSG